MAVQTESQLGGSADASPCREAEPTFTSPQAAPRALARAGARMAEGPP
jgi:hypothetical protein